jgi:hypothetical protein
MKRIRKKVAKRKAARKVQRHSAVLGLLSDLFFVLRLLIGIISWPVKSMAHVIHSSLRQHPQLRYKHMHSVVCIIIGLGVLTLSFWLETLSHHPLASVSVETLRAAGVCPIWESLAAIMKLSSEFEA